jgi:hypothetical protein
MKFQMYKGYTCLILHGLDDNGGEFRVTLDRIWVGNLVQEMEEWLSEPVAEVG